MRVVLFLLTFIAVSHSAVHGTVLYWTEAGQIRRLEVGGSPTLVSPTSTPIGVATDTSGQSVYWTVNPPRVPIVPIGQIFTAPASGGIGVELLGSLPSPGGIEVDSVGGKMYWTDGELGLIRRANLDGTNAETIVPGVGAPTDVTIDRVNSKLYWSWVNPQIDSITPGFIMRSNLDGNQTESVVGSLTNPQGVAIDPAGGKVYWTDEKAIGEVQRANLDGTGVETIVTGLVSPANIAIDPLAPTLYWTDFTQGMIRRSNLDGSNVQVVVSNLVGPIGIAAAVPEPSAAFLLAMGGLLLISWRAKRIARR